MSGRLELCAIFLASFLAMEGVAWATHKYAMHGFLWCLHKSHHEPRKGAFELNDLFGLFFAAISVAFFAWSAGPGGPLWALPVGLGMAAYGAVYFLAHDVLVHNRGGWRIGARNGYLARLYQAHRLHHAVSGKDGCVSFGFVFARSPGHLKRELRRLGELRAGGNARRGAKRASATLD